MVQFGLLLGMLSLANPNGQEKPFVADSIPYSIISDGGTAGEYQAFPDACRLKNGDIVAVFYSGGAHVTYPSDAYPKCGRICLVRSKDDGITWTKPVTIFDDEWDNRDPHISQMADGTLVCTFFTTKFGAPKERNPSASMAYYGNVVTRESLPGPGPLYIRSFDNGSTWEKQYHAPSSEAVGTALLKCDNYPMAHGYFPFITRMPRRHGEASYDPPIKVIPGKHPLQLEKDPVYFCRPKQM